MVIKMKNMLDRLKKSTIKSIISIHDYWQIYLDIGVMNIYNPLYFYHDNIKEPFSNDLSGECAGQKITRIVFKDSEHISLKLSNKNFLVISLRDMDYTGPEAVVIYSREIIVI